MNGTSKVELRVVDRDTYEGHNGWTLKREEGESPNGSPFRRRWVLRFRGDYIDHDQYRNDLAERQGLNLRSARLTD